MVNDVHVENYLRESLAFVYYGLAVNNRLKNHSKSTQKSFYTQCQRKVTRYSIKIYSGVLTWNNFFITRSLLIKIFMLPSKALQQMIFLISETAFESHVPLNQKSQTLISNVSSLNIKSCLTSTPYTANQMLDPVQGIACHFWISA